MADNPNQGSLMDSVLERSFLVPLRRDKNLSDGDLHSTESWDWLDDQLWDRFDGLTIAPGTYAGSYKDPDTGERIGDESRRYIVALAEGRVDELREVLSGACLVFHQKCIYLSVAGRVSFVEGPSHGEP